MVVEKSHRFEFSAAPPATRGTDCLLVKVMDSWPACHEFESSTAEDPPRLRRCTLNLSKLKRPSVGMLWKLEEGGASSGVVLVT
ncbi:hypothetical protein TNCV_3747191 [Trichonephila clavipes]|nr:hypothetical protein TNCV_3747191 [Trichonephila clavipes]